MNVTFDEEQQIARTPVSTGTSGLYALVIRWGFAKDQRQANIVLLILAGVMILSIIVIWIMSSGAPQAPTHEELIRMQQQEGV